MNANMNANIDADMNANTSERSEEGGSNAFSRESGPSARHDTTANLYNPLWNYYILLDIMPYEGIESTEGGKGQQENSPEKEEQEQEQDQEQEAEDAEDETKSADDENDEDQDHESETAPTPAPEYELNEPPETPDTIPGLTRFTKNGTNYVCREFHSWSDFVESAANEKLYKWRRKHASHDPNQETAGASASFREALDMARGRGWPQGREMMYEHLASMAQQPHSFDVWQFDVAGAFPIVPMFIAGDPNCMITDPGSDLRTQYPIIRIDYNHACNWTVKPKEMMLRGAAVLSLANTLENHGFQTELRILWDSHGYDGTIFHYSIIYKKPGEYLDLDRAAFALAHPAAFRRLGFAILEQHPELEQNFTNYGYPLHEPIEDDETNFSTVYIPPARDGETRESARRAVEDAARATLETMTTAEAAD